jgi:hypothetical protein
VAVDYPDYTQAVNVVAGSVAISGVASVSILGTPSVSISGTPSVSISGTPNVNIQSSSVTLTVLISGTPSVTIASGSVTIANANIAVINAANTKITSARPPVRIMRQFWGANSTATQTTGVLDSDVQALVCVIDSALNTLSHLKIAFSNASLAPVVLELFAFAQQIYAAPLLPIMRDSNTNLDRNTLDVTVTATAAGNCEVSVWALYESAPEWLTIYPTPQLAPNQTPSVGGSTALANSTSLWLVTPTANVKVSVFEITTLFIQGTFVGAGYYLVGHGTVLPVAQPAQANWLFLSGNTGAFQYEFHGATLPAGEGVYLFNASGNPLLAWHLITYSLS